MLVFDWTIKNRKLYERFDEDTEHQKRHLFLDPRLTEINFEHHISVFARNNREVTICHLKIGLDKIEVSFLTNSATFYCNEWYLTRNMFSWTSSHF